MLSGSVSLSIPGVASVMNGIDGQKARFLAIPSNVRAALDRLARIIMLVDKNQMTGAQSQAVHQTALTVKNNLERTQLEWDQAAADFQQLDDLRRGNVQSVSLDTIMIASKLASSAGYVFKNADANVAAVDRLAKTYLTPEQQKQLDLDTTGTVRASSMAIPAVLVIGLLGAFFLMRRRR